LNSRKYNCRARDYKESQRATDGHYDHELWKKESQRLFGWRHIAARDGAMQIYHFGMAMAKIRGQLHNVPTIKPLVDANKL
jgi:hypothetical protein